MTPLLLSHPHPTHVQILPTEPLESLSSLSFLASSTHITLVLTTVFAHLDKGQHLLTHLLASLLVLRQSIPIQKSNDLPFGKAMSSCHSRLSTPSGARSHWDRDSESSSQVMRTYCIWSWTHMTWFSIALLYLYCIPALKLFLLLL